MSRNRDRWSHAGAPSDADMARINRGIDQVMADIVARPHIPTSASMIPDNKRDETPPRAPSGGTVELKPPEGINHVDAIASSFAKQDRVALIRQQIESAWIEAQLRGDRPLVESEFNPFSRENLAK